MAGPRSHRRRVRRRSQRHRDLLANGRRSVFTLPLTAAIQEIAARIGRCTGRGIADNVRRHYPPWLLHGAVSLQVVANTINLGADLGALGDAVRLLIGGPRLLFVVLLGALSASPEIPFAALPLRTNLKTRV